MSASLLQLPATFGRYRLLKQLGQGGMGVVFLAEDTTLHRQVALKMPRFEGASSPEMVERFYREARTAATLQHANICPIFDVGEVSGVHYLTMAYLEGRPLAQFIKPGQGLAPRTAAILVRKLAQALDEAHRRGIIHRDLKPSNIMITVKNEPVILDFGLARSTNDSRLTGSQAVMGTPAYMAPEQARGDTRSVGPAADIYAIGVILFEALTGRLPFEGPPLAVMHQLLNNSPPAPSSLKAGIDPALEKICLQALAREPQGRFPSMAAFAAALTAYLKGDSTVVPSAMPMATLPLPAPVTTSLPVAAPMATTITESASVTVLSPLKTKRGVLIGAALVALFLCLAGFFAIKALRSPKDDSGQVGKEEKKDKDKNKDGDGDKDDDNKDKPSDDKPSDKDKPKPAPTEPKQEPGAIHSIDGHTGVISAVVFLPDGKRAVSAGADWLLRVWEVETARQVKEISAGSTVQGLLLLPGGEKILVAIATGAIHIVDLEDGKKVGELKGHQGVVHAMALHARSQRLLTGGADNTVRLWDLKNNQEIRKFQHKGDVTGVDISPDGKLGVSAGNDLTVRLWDLENLKPKGPPLEGLVEYSYCAKFMPDGKSVLVSGGWRNAALLEWDVKSGKIIDTPWDVDKTKPIQAMKFLPDGKRMLTCDYVGRVQLWDLKAKQPSHTWEKHKVIAHDVAVSPGGRRALSVSSDKVIWYWSLPDEE